LFGLFVSAILIFWNFLGPVKIYKEENLDLEQRQMSSFSTSIEVKKCGHKCYPTKLDKCCSCSDLRPITESYPSYVDGIGQTTTPHRNEHYCPVCNPENKERWEKKAVESQAKKKREELERQKVMEENERLAENDRILAMKVSSSGGLSSEPQLVKYSNGDVYVGELSSDGFRHGFGRMDYGPNEMDQLWYVGEWENGNPQGFGKKHWLDDLWYEGNWNNGKMHGVGHCHMNEVESLEGVFVEDEYEGAADQKVTISCQCGQVELPDLSPPTLRIECSCRDCRFKVLNCEERKWGTGCNGPRLPTRVKTYHRGLHLTYFKTHGISNSVIDKLTDSCIFSKIRPNAASTNMIAKCCGTIMVIDHWYYDQRVFMVIDDVARFSTQLPPPVYINDWADIPPEHRAIQEKRGERGERKLQNEETSKLWRERNLVNDQGDFFKRALKKYEEKGGVIEVLEFL